MNCIRATREDGSCESSSDSGPFIAPISPDGAGGALADCGYPPSSGLCAVGSLVCEFGVAYTGSLCLSYCGVFCATSLLAGYCESGGGGASCATVTPAASEVASSAFKIARRNLMACPPLRNCLALAPAFRGSWPVEQWASSG